MHARVPTSTLFHHQAGQGSENLLLFHGFGQTHTIFSEAIHVLQHDYTCYVFDLYFHGNSHWEGDGDNDTLTKEAWQRTLQHFLQQHNLNTFSVLGYSLGGKFALATLEAFPDRVREIFLLAPDGIHTSFWYSLATYPAMFRKLFRSMIDHPNRFFTLTKTLHRLGLLDRGLVRFAEHQMNTAEKRQRVYSSWVVFRHLKFDLKKIGQLINHHHIRIMIITGRYDKIIPAKNMHRLLKNVNHHTLLEVEAGHNGLLGKEVIRLIHRTS
jgi:pimeloyl-ACP methyl ester carboxylesterase